MSNPGAVIASSLNESIGRRIRIVLIDSFALFRMSLGRTLSAEPDLEIAGECSSFPEALRFLSESPHNTDLVILDFEVGGEDAEKFIPAARHAGYEGRFLIVAASPDVRRSALMLSAGASGVFLKSDSPQRLAHAIRDIMNGDVWIDRTIVQLLANQLTKQLSPSVNHQVPIRIDGQKLREREKTVLQGIMQGLSNKQIGARLGMSEGTAKNVVQHLFALTGVRTRSQLVRMAFEGSLCLAEQPVQTGVSVSDASHGTGQMRP